MSKLQSTQPDGALKAELETSKADKTKLLSRIEILEATLKQLEQTDAEMEGKVKDAETAKEKMKTMLDEKEEIVT